MARVVRALVGLIGGHAAGVGLGIALLSLMSQNTHDKSVEVAMTSALVTGPIGAVLGLIAGLLITRRA